MEVHAKVLDAYVKTLSTAALHDSLRTLQVQMRRDGELDAHESEFARAYRVKHGDGSFGCLRFWKTVPPDPSFLLLYSALERSPEICDLSSMPRVTLVPEAITVRGAIVPAVLMDWVAGTTLGDYLAHNWLNPPELWCAADALLQLFTTQNDARISHGDLRASNVLIQSDADTVRVGMIDLDSVRWSDGPSLPRTVGGNPAWDDLRKQHRVTALEHDYLDQAMIYLTFVALSMDSSRWPGPTDDFLTLDYLLGDPEETLSLLEKLAGPPGRIATTVRRVIHAQGHWLELQSAMTGELPSSELDEAVFWGRAFLRTSASLTTATQASPAPQATATHAAPASQTPAPQAAPAPQATGPQAAPAPPSSHKRLGQGTSAPRPAAPASMSSTALPSQPRALRRRVSTSAGLSSRPPRTGSGRWARWVITAGLLLLLAFAYYIWKHPERIIRSETNQPVYFAGSDRLPVSAPGDV